MAKLLFDYNNGDIFLRDLAEQFVAGKMTSDEYLDILEDLVRDIDRQKKTNVNHEEN